MPKKDPLESYESFARFRRDPKRLKAMRPYLLDRAKGCCQICDLAVKEILIIHHIIGMKHFMFGMDQNDPSNLLAICPNCHALVHLISRYGELRREGVRMMDWPRNRDLLVETCGLTPEQAERMLIVATEWAEFADGVIRLLPKENNRYSPKVPVHQPATLNLEIESSDSQGVTH